MVSTVIFGQQLIDLSQDTVCPEVLLTGYTAHDKAGNLIVGTMGGSPMGEPSLPTGDSIAVNKVVFGGTVLIDLTADTVAPQVLAAGYTAHGANGQLITGIHTGEPGFYFPFSNESLTQPMIEFVEEE